MFLSIESLSVAYNGRVVLEDVSFTLPEGEALAIMGPSGCGKTTLLRILAGLVVPGGVAAITGSAYIDSVSPLSYRKSGNVGFMFQEATLLPHLTVSENITLPLQILDRSTAGAKEVIDMVGLTQFAGYLPKDLSGGMKARVALARSFVTKPSLLLLDEPFVSLDLGWKLDLYAEVNLLRQSHNTTLLVVTHDVHESMCLATNLLVMNSRGRVGLVANTKEQSNEGSFHKRVQEVIMDEHPSIVPSASGDGVRAG